MRVCVSTPQAIKTTTIDIITYVIVILQYKYNILVITQVQDEAEDMGRTNVFNCLLPYLFISINGKNKFMYYRLKPEVV